MRIIAYFIIGAAVAVLGIPAYAQTVLKNDTGGWTPVMDVVGPNDEPIGRDIPRRSQLWCLSMERSPPEPESSSLTKECR